MSSSIIENKLKNIFYECDKHIFRIQYSTKKMAIFMPLTKDTFIKLSDDRVGYIDQFLFRFAKLQDTMGQKLFKLILIYLDEDIENKPFVDILNRMEKLYLLESANEWKELRDNRNELAHNYENKPEEMSQSINTLYDKKDVLISIHQNIKSFYLKKVKNNEDLKL